MFNLSLTKLNYSIAQYSNKFIYFIYTKFLTLMNIFYISFIDNDLPLPVRVFKLCLLFVQMPKVANKNFLSAKFSTEIVQLFCVRRQGCGAASVMGSEGGEKQSTCWLSTTFKDIEI